MDVILYPLALVLYAVAFVFWAIIGLIVFLIVLSIVIAILDNRENRNDAKRRLKEAAAAAKNREIDRNTSNIYKNLERNYHKVNYE